ncbi:hypothetical protein PHLGIDRAFT_130535 [Phlebiopsis gigantea 11061_1 CR5-6]|uniref:VIT domain-containing protein n=1 Tax=Phlebiopsis gigantea (strain 11061_1 CR5-6) TaxID=745531 RepID=A0A0C3S124_PHLG1|nr:hypothetical protein PHLGIDRAFT_130535 [Phlebiopsis gigantea 11061_1 CR5-6]
MRIPHTTKPCGIILAGAEHGTFLPLERVEVHVDVVDVSALVTVSQHFWQFSPVGLTQAKYVFPVPARAAVCGFEMAAEDGKIITAVVKEREEARREHQAALSQGLMTGLVEHVTDDIFSISLGALPRQQMITCKLTYVLDLMEDDISDQVRLQLPMCIGMRFGYIPPGMQDARPIHPDCITISVDIRMQGAVKKINSPTHPTVLVSDPELADGIRSVRHTSPDFMVRDFVLLIAAEGLDAPRCFAQRASNGTLAMQLSVVPKFDLSPIPRQEYIFLVDRSGSMGGQRIETAKRSLMLLLRALPSHGTWFNVFSFGSVSDSLWSCSVEYGEQSINHATQHIDGMTANYGGTEIQGALEHVLRTRKTDLPSAIFVLTDGETYNIEQTIMPIKISVDQAAKNAPLRVFTLGIGMTTSTALCEGMARAGNGVCLMAATTETIIGKCSRLVRASRTYILKNVSIDWGVRTTPLLVPPTSHVDNSKLRQAPATVSAIYPGTRFVVFALVEDTAFTPPKEVVIRAQRDGQGDLLQFTVPVQLVDFPPDRQHQPLIQTLAARRAIMDLDDSASYSPDKPLIVRLGIKYQLASKFTSFIAVDKRTRAEVPGPVAAHSHPHSAGTLFGSFGASQSSMAPRTAALFGQPRSNAPQMAACFGQAAYTPAAPAISGASLTGGSFAFPALQHLGTAGGGVFGTASPPAAHATSGRSAFAGTASPMLGASRNLGFQTFRQSTSTARWFTPSINTTQTVTPQAEYPMDVSEADPMDTSDDIMSPHVAAHSGTQSIDDAVAQLVLLQSFDGSFPPDKHLLDLLDGVVSVAEAQSLGVSERIWATCLAVAYLRVRMNDQPELLDGLVEKAKTFISQTPGVNMERLFAHARAVVAS